LTSTARDERARAEHERVVLALAALERLAVDEAFEVDHDLIAFFRLRALAALLEVLRVLGQVFQRFGDGRFFGLHDQTLQRDARQVNVRDFRQRFVGHGHDHVHARLPGLAVLHLDLRLHRRTVARFLEQIRHRAVDGTLPLRKPLISTSGCASRSFAVTFSSSSAAVMVIV
jgi:hypothetical protein